MLEKLPDVRVPESTVMPPAFTKMLAPILWLPGRVSWLLPILVRVVTPEMLPAKVVFELLLSVMLGEPPEPFTKLLPDKFAKVWLAETFTVPLERTVRLENVPGTFNVTKPDPSLVKPLE